MARILITSFGSFGDVNPYIGLGLELRRRGHRVVLGMSSIYRSAIEDQGLEFHHVRPDVDPEDGALMGRIMDPARGTETIFAEILLPSLAASYDDLLAASDGADLVVTHPTSLAAPVVAEQRGLPWVSSVLAPMSFFSVSDPVVPPPAPWLHALLTRSRLASRGFVWLADRMTGRWGQPVRDRRRALGLPDRGNPILAGQHSPHGVLALFSRALGAPQPDWPPRTTLTGPILYNANAAPDVSDEIARFLAAGSPPVVFTLGSSAVEAAGGFYEASAAAVARLGCRAILLVGRHARHRPAEATGDILAVDYAPHAQLFPQAAAIVHQGGVGTLHQALAAGRPMLVVPHAHDQPDNAMRAARLGVARVLTPTRYTEASVSEALTDLLTEGRYRQRAEAVGAEVRAEAGSAAARAADALEAAVSERAATA